MGELLANQAAVVTGASSGIGRGIARTYAEHGADVVVADIRADPREGGTPTHELVSEETDSRATFVECDVSELDDLEAAAEAADELGGLDVWVNNAGVFRNEAFLDVTRDEFADLMRVNVLGSFFGAQVAARRMVDREDGGRIVNVSSIAGILGNGGYVTYCVSKGAVRLLTYALAHRLGPEGVRVNAIHPGGVETAMMEDSAMTDEEREAFVQQIPSRRLGGPDDVADAALFLASDLSSYVNGESLIVDGGYTNTG